MASLVSNNILELISGADVDFDAVTFNIILMAPGFTFNRVNHDEYLDLSVSELPTAYGYTIGGVVLAGVATTRSDLLNALLVTWNNAAWPIAGGNLQACGAVIIAASIANDPVVGFIDFGGTMTTYNGGTYTVANIALAIAGV